MASAHGNLAHLLPPNFKRMVSSWLEEDCPSFDYGGFVVGEKMAQARLWGKSGVRRNFSTFLLCKKENIVYRRTDTM